MGPNFNLNKELHITPLVWVNFLLHYKNDH